MVLGALALGGILGSAATVVVTDGDDGSRPEAAVRSPESAAVALPAARADAAWGRSTSADALARWAEAERQARVELCTSAPSSADALSRCLGDRG